MSGHEFEDLLKPLPDDVRARVLKRYNDAPCSKNRSESAKRDGLVAIIEKEKAGGTKESPPVPGWPVLDDKARQGLAGEFVELTSPNTEADNVALLIQFLIFFGNVVGRGAHFVAEADRHYTNQYAVLVGDTAKGRKGSSYGHVLARFGALDVDWSRDRIVNGLSSGEGLIYAVRDGTSDTDPGVSDKRLLVMEPEFASVLRHISRQGNTLSSVVRTAWDGHTLNTMTKNSPAKATEAHVSIIGHVTGDELRRYLDQTEQANGFANRFLWICSRRSKLLPEGGKEPANYSSFQKLLAAAVQGARRMGHREIKRDGEARKLWIEKYRSLSEGLPGLLGGVTSRAEAHVMRLALLYALLETEDHIGRRHLEAGLAVWQYALDSARYVFGEASGDPDADRLLAALKAAPNGLTLTAIDGLFGKHMSAARRRGLLAGLLGRGLAHCEKETTDGRDTERWFAGPSSANPHNPQSPRAEEVAS